MKLDLLIDGKTRTLEKDGSGAYKIDSDPVQADVREVAPGVYSVLVEGRNFEVRLERDGEDLSAAVNGRRYSIVVEDPRRLPRTRGAIQAAGRQRVTSPMPGRVIRVLAGEGEQVAAGQGLVVVEAMKMQNQIRSPKAGRVAALHAKEGAAVAGGETLAEVE